jgi:PKD repeat protein
MKHIFTFFLAMVLSFGLLAQETINSASAKDNNDLTRILKHNADISLSAAIEKTKNIDYPKRMVSANGRIKELVGISSTGMPIYLETTNNLDAAKTIGTSKVWPSGASGLSLSGQGMTNRLGVWDGGAVRIAHQEFQSRAVQVDGSTSLSDHATHVAGTMAAGGVVANAKGMAYQAPIRCYDWNSDNSEMSSAASAGLLVSNHSYSQISGWSYNDNLSRWEFWADPSVSTTEDYKYGFYDWNSQEWDQIALTYPNYLIFVAAGNDRGEAGSSTYWIRDNNGSWVQGNSANKPPATGPYDCISGGPANAKNVMTIGAVNKIVNGWSKSSDVVMSSFSGWGPTDDGRIKPDVVANGVSVYSSTSTNNTAYANLNGTSMATPNASGSALLLQQHFNNRKGSFMRSSTLKGLIIHTADEAGSNPGPDYSFGWGLMNTDKAATVITDSLKNSIQQLSLSNSGTYTYSFYADGISPIRATICWTDRPAVPLNAAVDATNKRLVNDLDIRLRRNSDNTNFFPYVLNPASPASAATTGDNNTDNTELIHLGTPTAGIYTITISHKGTLTGGAQPYALIVSGITPKPTAGFTSNSKTVCMNQSVAFTNLSVGGTARMWYFPGGNPATSTALNPNVSYAAPGSYPVALRISSSNGYDSIYITDYLTVGGVSLPIDETFESNSPTRNLWTIDNLQGDSTWRLWNIAGTTPGNTAMGINNYDVTTQFYTDRIVSPVLDLRGLSAASLQFQHAYTRYDNSATDSLIVLISTNCGTTYTRLGAYGENGTGTFATGPDNSFASVNAFIPSKAADWCGGGLGAACNTFNLSSFVGNANVRIRFEQKTNNGGNNLFIDNIKIVGTPLAPVAKFYTLTPSVCVGDEIQLLDSSYNQPKSWTWYVSDADTTFYTVRSPQVKFLSAGTKTISLVVKNATGQDSFTRVAYINVLPSPAIPAITSSKGNAVCDGDSTLISTDAASNFVWYKNNLVFATSGPSFTTKEEGLYYVRVRGANGCWAKSQSLDLMAAVTPPKPTFTKDLTGTQFCEGGVFNLTSSATTGNQWFVNDTLFNGATNRILNYNAAGTFKVQISNKGCLNMSDPLSIEMLPRPQTGELTGNTWAVKGDTARFKVVPGVSGSIINWTLSGGTIESGATTPEVLIRFGSTNTATINVQENGSNGCKGITKTINVNLVNTSLVAHQKGELKLFPNPASNYLNLQLTQLATSAEIKVSLYNVLGQEIKHEQVKYNGQGFGLNLADLTSGVYVIKVEAQGKVFTRNFVKQ